MSRSDAATRVLIAGVGNIFASDDGFGPAVVEHLAAADIPDGVVVVDYGIRGVHLAFDVADRIETLILVDTVPDAGGPGSVVVQEIGPGLDGNEPAPIAEAHSMDPAAVVQSIRSLGSTMPRTLLVGCEPASLADGIGLTDAVAAAVPAAAAAALQLATLELRNGSPDDRVRH